MRIMPIVQQFFNNKTDLNKNQQNYSPYKMSYLSKTQPLDTVVFTAIPNSEKLRKLFAYDIPCMYSGITMIDPRKASKLLNSGALSGSTNDTLHALSPYEDSMFAIEKQMFKIMKEQTQINPHQKLSELVKDLVPIHTKILRDQQRHIFDKLTDKAYELPDEIFEQFEVLMENTNKRLNNEPVLVPFSSYEFKYKLEKISKGITNKNIPKEILYIKKITKLANQLNDTSNFKTRGHQAHIVRKISYLLEKSPLNNNMELQKLCKQSLDRINNKPIPANFSRKSFIYDLQNILTPLEDIKLKNKLIEIAVKLPTSRENLSAFILKSAEDSSEKIAYRLISGSTASVEHLKPASKGGANELYNFAPASNYFNSERSNKSFAQQLKDRPETYINSQKCMDRLIELYNNGTFAKIGLGKNYIFGFKQTVYKLSHKNLLLDTSKLKD